MTYILTLPYATLMDNPDREIEMTRAIAAHSSSAILFPPAANNNHYLEAHHPALVAGSAF
jgi:hypothetical protein